MPSIKQQLRTKVDYLIAFSKAFETTPITKLTRPQYSRQLATSKTYINELANIIKSTQPYDDSFDIWSNKRNENDFLKFIELAKGNLFKRNDSFVTTIMSSEPESKEMANNLNLIASLTGDGQNRHDALCMYNEQSASSALGVIDIAQGTPYAAVEPAPEQKDSTLNYWTNAVANTAGNLAKTLSSARKKATEDDMDKLSDLFGEAVNISDQGRAQEKEAVSAKQKATPAEKPKTSWRDREDDPKPVRTTTRSTAQHYER